MHCIAGCGKCWSIPEIDASPLEFLPWAFHLFLNGEAEEMLLQLQQKSDSNCHLYCPHSFIDRSMGSCSDYRYRVLVCRLFEYEVNRNK